jgi:hypothetical protein
MPRRESPLELRAVYTTSELARIANISADRMRRLLRGSGVELLRAGRILLVPLSEIARKVPSLWESIKDVESASHGPR